LNIFERFKRFLFPVRKPVDCEVLELYPKGYRLNKIFYEALEINKIYNKYYFSSREREFRYACKESGADEKANLLNKEHSRLMFKEDLIYSCFVKITKRGQ
jgi:hypothetical protein